MEARVILSIQVKSARAGDTVTYCTGGKGTREYSRIVQIFGLVTAHSPRLSCTFTVISTSGCVSRSSRLDITKSPLSRLTVTGELSASG